MFRQISSRIRLPRNSRDILHAANLRHGTDGFTSPPKEGMLRIFPPLKIRRLRLGLNLRTWVPKASTLPLDHWSQYLSYIVQIIHNNMRAKNKFFSWSMNCVCPFVLFCCLSVLSSLSFLILYSVEIPTRCSFVIEFIIPKFIYYCYHHFRQF